MKKQTKELPIIKVVDAKWFPKTKRLLLFVENSIIDIKDIFKL